MKEHKNKSEKEMALFLLSYKKSTQQILGKKMKNPTLFEQLKAVVEKEIKKNPKYLSSYQSDFYEIDKDELEGESLPGNRYIFTLKGSGMGTYMRKCGFNSEIQNDSSSRTLKDKHFVIDVVSEKQLKIQEASRELASQVLKTSRANIKSKRITLGLYLKDLVDLSPSALGEKGVVLSEKGEVVAICVSNAMTDAVVSVMVKKKGKNESPNLIELQVEKSLEKFSKEIDCKTSYFKFEVTSPYGGRGEITPITKKTYDKAVSIGKNRKESDLTL